MILEALLSAMVLLVMIGLFFKTRRPAVWVIDDSESDLVLYKSRLKLDEYDVRYFNSVKQISISMWLFRKPAAVLVDYYLKDNIDGDEVMRFCKTNHIPALLITGYEGDIIGVERSKIRIKSPEDSFYRGLEKFVRDVTWHGV